MRKSPEQSFLRIGMGGEYQLAQESGEAPFISLGSITAPASSRSWIASSSPKAAARGRGVSPFFLQSRMKSPVFTLSLVSELGVAPSAVNNFSTRVGAGRF